ncbi:MAG TPA: IS256 family transposase, partial [Roseibacterium sp.]|nr:IS256 family transposase [Roseibacterium sp.]
MPSKEGEIHLSFQLPQIMAAMHGAVESLAGEAGLLIMKALIDEEVEQRAGPRYEHAEDREAQRWGHEDGYVVFGGRKVAINRPRLRGTKGGEIELERYRMFQADSRMRDDVVRRVVRGVSTRDYEGAIDGICEGYGVQKSSVSRHWKAATTEELAKLMERPLGDLDLVAIMIDGVAFQDYMLIVAIGITSEGEKKILGIWDGATENAEVVTSLLRSLLDRGLSTAVPMLFVIDGSKALKKAIKTIFGDQAKIQRCQIHKERNVLSHLPDNRQARTRRQLRAAWGLLDYEEAKIELKKIAKMLDGISPGAAASLLEGLEETLTLQKLQIPAKLWKSLRSTNLIEGTFARTRELCKNVKRWSSADMALRWAST